MVIHVRQARPADAEVTCLVVRESIQQCCVEDHENDPARVSAWLRNKTPQNFVAWTERDDLYCVVAESEAGVVGFSMASIQGELLLCYVAPAALYQRVGKAVLQEIERWAGAARLTELRLESTKTALPFYKRNGYVACAPAVIFGGMASQPMRKPLPNATQTR
jgi:GNAT superfamily N-acetyltransferase